MTFDVGIAATLAYLRKNEALVEVALFALGFLESFVFTSIFVPASLLFIAIGVMHGAAGGEFLPLLLSGTAGCFAGDLASYWVGWRFRDELPRRWPFKANPEWLPKARSFFERWGIAGVIAAKFIGPMRPIVPVVGGALHMPWALFAMASATSSIVWAAVFLVPGYYGLQLLK